MLLGLDVAMPVLAAPMAGGPTTPALVVAAGAAGSLGLLAAGYKTPELLAEEIGVARASGVLFGVNLFVPNPQPVQLSEFGRYARAIQPDAEAYGLDVTGAEPVDDDDWWQAKVDLLTSGPVPVVSFTFGLPEPAVVKALHKAGSILVQTVTSLDEARMAAERGVDLLAVQSFEAGGHWGTFTPERPPATLPLIELVRTVRAAISLPLVAAGGIGTPEQVAGALTAGASAVMVGTVLLRAPESGTSAPYRSALGTATGRDTVVTKAFTGRPARALPNHFSDWYSDAAPFGYPAIHHLTSPIRRAAAAAGDHERINLWAGTGFRHAREEPVAHVLGKLAERS